MNKKLIYTSLVGTYDKLKEPTHITPGWDYIAYTDQDIPTGSVWTKSEIVGDTSDKQFTSRFYKLKGQHTKNYQTSVYIDASYRITGDLDKFIEGKTEGVWFRSHPRRDCLYEEANVVREKALDNPTTVNEQIARYIEEGYPAHNGLYRGGVFVTNKGTEEFRYKWWEEVVTGSNRDQISLPYAAWVTGTKINNIAHGEVETFFKPYLHEPHELTGGIKYVSDSATISKQPTDAWICFGDFPLAEQATKEYPLVHLIVGENGMLFPRWLWNYIPMTDRMEEMVKIYSGSYAYYFR